MSTDAATTGVEQTRQAHWDTVAERFGSIGPPLRPCAADVDVVRRAVCDYAGDRAPRALRCALLGVTPELAGMDWPASARLCAIEHSTAMIRRNWPGNVDGGRHVFCANWLMLPLATGAFDVVVADGSLNSLDYPDDYHTLSARVRHALTPGGLFITRLFIQPAHRESTNQVFDALRAGRIGNFHVFKFRLAMAMHQDGMSGVRLGDVWSQWADAAINPSDLAARNGWPLAAVETINLYKDKDARLSFPTLHDAKALLARRFDVVDCVTPDYEMGDRCPTFVLRRR